VVDEEGRHAEAGGVADAKRAAQIGARRTAFSPPRHAAICSTRSATKARISQTASISTRNGPSIKRPARHGVVIGGAELARAVDGGRAHQVADLVDARGVGLLPLREAVDHMFPQAARPIGAGQDHLTVADAARLLPGHVGGEPLDIAASGSPSISAKVVSQASAITRSERR
jgi:hypothetical protein